MPTKTAARQRKPLSTWARCEGHMVCGELSEPLKFEAPSECGAEAGARNELGRWLASLVAANFKKHGWSPDTEGSFRVQWGDATLTGGMVIRVQIDHRYPNEGGV